MKNTKANMCDSSSPKLKTKLGAICVILARRNSKRITNKHIQTINGITLIEHAINKVLSVNIFDKVVLSTDCEDCISIGKSKNIDIIRRSSHLCLDDSCLADSFRDAIEKSVEMYGTLYKYGCLFTPTAFMVSDNLLRRMYKIIQNPQLQHDNPRANTAPWGAVITTNGSYPWFFDLRPGATAMNQKVLDYYDTVDEIVVDIHNQQDLDRARLLYQWIKSNE